MIPVTHTHTQLTVLPRSWAEANVASGGALAAASRTLALRCPDLTNKQRKVCALIAAGYTSDEIASVLAIRSHSIDNQRNRIRKKLGLEHGTKLDAFLISMTGEINLQK